MPPARTRAQTNWSAIGIRYEEALSLPLVPLLTMAATSSPMVMAHWYVATTAPRIHLGELENKFNVKMYPQVILESGSEPFRLIHRN